MRRIKVLDTTLRDGEQSPGCSMNISEKLEMAKQLEALGVDVIEAGFAITSPDDFKSVQVIAKSIQKSIVASLARCTKGDIDAAWNAVKGAKHPRIHVFLATSDIHMACKLKMTREQVIASIQEMVSYAKSLCDDIEFSAEDASRSEPAFLAQCYSAAIAAGAGVINVADTVGYSTPEEMYQLVSYIKTNVAGADTVDISVHCHNDLGLAVANTMACIRAGATQVECTVNGIGERAGNASLEEVVMGLYTRRDYYQAETGVHTKQIYRSSRLLSSITGIPVSPNKPVVGANAFAHEAGIHQHGVISNAATYEIMRSTDVGIPQHIMVLGKHSGKHALRERIEMLGYQVSEQKMDDVFTRFKALADQKKSVTDADLEALMMSQRHMIATPVYELMGHVVNTGHDVPNTACIKIKKADESFEEVAMGTGPIDAAFKAINRITQMDVNLESYSLNAVTDGEDAMGEAVVKLSHEGESFTGRGLSTDIIESSIRAYVNGINKILGA